MAKAALTDRLVRNLKPEPKSRIVWDERQTGFGVQVTPKGTKTFKVVYRHSGKLRWFTIDKFPNILLADARDVARKVRARAALGEDPQGEKVQSRVAQREGKTLSDIATLYVENKAKRENKSWQQAHNLMQRYVLPKLGARKIGDIERGDIRRIFNHLTIEKERPALANQVLAAVSAVLSWAAEQEYVGQNVARGIKRNTRKSAERFLSDDELRTVWFKVEDLGFFEAMALRLILLTAQRPGEVCAMRWQDVDLDNAVWTQPGDPDGDWPGTKSGRTHAVPLSPEAVAVLQELDPQDDGFVFPRNGGHMRIPNVKPIWEALKIERFRPHDLRATAATGMDQLGIPKEHISRVLNHKEGGVTSGYIRHEHFEQKRRALEAWCKHCMAIVEGRELPSSVVDIRSAKDGA